MGLVQRVVQYIVQADLTKIPAEMIEKGKHCILDGIGCPCPDNGGLGSTIGMLLHAYRYCLKSVRAAGSTISLEYGSFVWHLEQIYSS